MSSTFKYKITERYSMGWTDPRVMVSRVQIKIGNYTIANLIGVSGSPHPSKVEIMHTPKDTPIESLYANQQEFAACIEAFLKEQHERNNSGL